MTSYCFYVYITTNPQKSVLYTGRTNHLEYRLIEHYLNRGKPDTFAGKYYCYNLLYFEDYQYVEDAILIEKEIKGWKRIKKLALIKDFNPSLKFLNAQVMDWPPVDPHPRTDFYL
jgi:putative endonuclease